VLDGGRPTAAENSTDFLPPAAGKRAGAGVAEGIAGSRAARHRERPVACAMAMAGRDAALPALGKRVVGGTHGPADAADGARTTLPFPGAPGRAARVYQENARDAGG